MLFITQKVHMIHSGEIKCTINRNFMQSCSFFVWFTKLSANHLLPMILRKNKISNNYFLFKITEQSSKQYLFKSIT